MKKRVISAIVLMAIALTAVFISATTRVLLFAAAAVITCGELTKRFSEKGIVINTIVLIIYVIAQAALVIFGKDLEHGVILFAFALFLAFATAIIQNESNYVNVIYTVFALCYPCLPYGLLMYLSVSTIWKEALLLGAVSMWICDSCAMFGGIKFGKRKLAPDISPNKTVEGSICGGVAACIFGIIISLITDIPMFVSLVTCLVSTTAGQFGDLAESMLKRYLGVKDMSNLIPGHGGMFDRTDSLLFSIPAAYLLLSLF